MRMRSEECARSLLLERLLRAVHLFGRLGDDESPRDVLKRGDEAVYQARRAGRNRTVSNGTDTDLSDVA